MRREERTMKICKHCGAENPEELRVCAFCGKSLDEEEKKSAGLLGSMGRKRYDAKPEAPAVAQPRNS